MLFFLVFLRESKSLIQDFQIRLPNTAKISEILRSVFETDFVEQIRDDSSRQNVKYQLARLVFHNKYFSFAILISYHTQKRIRITQKIFVYPS